MTKLIDKTIERKANYVKFAYKKASYEIDQSLKSLLNKIAEIDGGPNADEYLKSHNYFNEQEEDSV